MTETQKLMMPYVEALVAEIIKAKETEMRIPAVVSHLELKKRMILDSGACIESLKDRKGFKEVPLINDRGIIAAR